MHIKFMAVTYILMITMGTILSLIIPKEEVAANEPIIIPNEAIRLRILANSDNEADQRVKRAVRDAVNAEITQWVEHLTSVEEARELIQQKMPEIQSIAEEVVESNGLNQTVHAEYGKNVRFPTKLYGEFLYPAGEYEAILVTLGAGQGANWWCVLFPPLCFLDFSNGVAVSDTEDDTATDETTQNDLYVDEDEQPVKVKFFLVELFEKIFG